MKALVLNGYGGNDRLSLQDRPKPIPASNQVLIRVSHAGLNPVDYKIRLGQLRLIRKLRFPHIMGNEIAGTVETIGSSVTRFRVGDRVYARLDKFEMGGCAEFVAEEEKNVAHAPYSIPPEVAAGIPLVALTAWQCLHEIGDVQKGYDVLIHGGAGSVGRFAIQFAKRGGADVTATGSEASRQVITTLGSDRFLDYRKERFESLGRRFDIVLDLVGGETLDRSFSVVKRGGIVISIAGIPDRPTARELGKGIFLQTLFGILTFRQNRLANQAGARFRYMFMHPDGQQLEQFSKWIDAGELVTNVDKVFALKKFAEAFVYQESGKAKGKVVLAVNGVQ